MRRSSHTPQRIADWRIADWRIADWSPLERALSAAFGAEARSAVRGFWFVGFVDGPDDVGELRWYEHCETHQAITLDVEGRAYRHYADVDVYGSVAVVDVLAAALKPGSELVLKSARG